MDVASATPSTTAQDSANRLLCAYSPTWLSGPTPGYRGLCPSWDEPRPDRSVEGREPSLF